MYYLIKKSKTNKNNNCNKNYLFNNKNCEIKNFGCKTIKERERKTAWFEDIARL